MLNSDSVFVPIDKELPSADVFNVLNHSDTTVLVYSGTFDKMLRENRDKIPNVTLFIGMDLPEDAESEAFISFEKLMKTGHELLDGMTELPKYGQADENAMKMLVYTSGTTGMAKGVMLSLHNLTSLVYHGLRVSTVYDCCLSVLPYHHTYEAVCGILVSLHKHATNLCVNDKNPQRAQNLQLFQTDLSLPRSAFAESFLQENLGFRRRKTRQG